MGFTESKRREGGSFLNGGKGATTVIIKQSIINNIYKRIIRVKFLSSL